MKPRLIIPIVFEGRRLLFQPPFPPSLVEREAVLGGGGGETARKKESKEEVARRRWRWRGQIKPITHPKTSSSPPRVSAGTPINASATPAKRPISRSRRGLLRLRFFSSKAREKRRRGCRSRVVVVVVVVSRDVPDLPLLRSLDSSPKVLAVSRRRHHPSRPPFLP